MTLVSTLQSRGLIQQTSDPNLDARLAELQKKETISAYVGFDPTANSLHLGNFLGIIALIWAQKYNIRPIGLAGGATGLIGDPSGKSSERQLLTKEQADQNVQGVKNLLARFLDFNHPTAPAMIVSNLDWFAPMTAIDFLRDVGKHFRIGPMLAKDSVKSRMESSTEGMSYTEFSYQLLQGYDFYRLYKDHNTVLQMGGSDQWGNITAGIDLIRKLQGESGHALALTWPLITTSSGQKFGKSEGNAIWLSADKTSPFDFYQFWLRTEDADVERYLKMFTFLPLEEIQKIVADHQTVPDQRRGQKKLAEEVTKLVHGPDLTNQAISASSTLYGGDSTQLDSTTVQTLTTQGVPTTTIPRAQFEAGLTILDAAIAAGLGKSKSDIRRLVQQGGLYLNNNPVQDVTQAISKDQLIDDSALILRAGKKNYRLLRIA